MKMLSGLSLFFPSFNDAKILPRILRDAYNVGRKVAEDIEIIVVDDGSVDDTPRVLARLQKTIPVLRIVRHKRNLGYGAALRSGFRAAAKQFVFYTDGDGQYDIDDLPLLVNKLNPNIDIVNGIKMKRNDGLDRIILGNIYASIIRYIFRLPIRDVDCDFRLIRRSVMKKVKLTTTSGAVCVELVKRLDLAGARFGEVYVHHYDRKFGHSQFYTLKNIWRTAKDLYRLWREL